VFPPVQPLRSAVGGNDSLVRLNAVTLVKSHVLEHAEPHPNYDVNDVRSLTESHNKHIYWHIMTSVDLRVKYSREILNTIHRTVNHTAMRIPVMTDIMLIDCI